MTIIRLKGFHFFYDRYRKLRCYHRATGTPVDLEKTPPGTAGFIAECARIDALAKAAAAKAAEAVSKAGTLGALIEAYRGSEAFQDLAPKTKHDYQTYFDYLRPIADTPLAHFDPPLVVRIRDKAARKGRRSGNYVKAILSLLFAWGVERGFLAKNPAKEIKNLKRPKDAPKANQPWTDEEREAVLAEAPDHMRPAIALMMFTGLGPKDALALTKASIKAGEISTSRAKTGEAVFWPMPRPLAAIFAAAPNLIAPSPFAPIPAACRGRKPASTRHGGLCASGSKQKGRLGGGSRSMACSIPWRSSFARAGRMSAPLPTLLGKERPR